MEEQAQNNTIIAPANPESGWLKMVLINIFISALVSLIIFFALAGSLSTRVLVLEQEMEKQKSGFIVK